MGSVYWDLRYSTPRTDAEFRNQFARQVKDRLQSVRPDLAEYLEPDDEEVSDLLMLLSIPSRMMASACWRFSTDLITCLVISESPETCGTNYVRSPRPQASVWSPAAGPDCSISAWTRNRAPPTSGRSSTTHRLKSASSKTTTGPGSWHPSLPAASRWMAQRRRRSAIGPVACRCWPQGSRIV